MNITVQKFGGSSVRDAERIENVANIVADTYNSGEKVVVVVSAQGKFTDELIEKAVEINPKASKREMDMLLASGEQISVALLAIALEKKGLPVISLTGWQAGFNTNSSHSAARIKKIDAERLTSELDKNKIVIVAGFQGVNKHGDITTLGRGGSDTSAVALAAALGADKCRIYTDVDGVYTADPRIVKSAVKIHEISYDEMLELASLGAQVLHHRSVEMAKRYNVELEVLSSLEKKPGTIVKEYANVEKMLIKGVARDNNVARISIVGVPDEPGIAFKTFSLLGKKKINVDIILQSLGRDNTQEISFTVPEGDMEEAVEILREAQGMLRFGALEYESDVCKVSVVGAGMATNAGVACKMFEALFEHGINIQMISTSEIKISVLIDSASGETAVKAIHDVFYN